jgi:NitT/TauT family transport system permease protein
MRFLKNTLIPLIFWLVVWAIAALAVGKELLLPGPWTVVRALGALAVTGTFWATTAATLARVFLGLLAGVVLGVAIAVLTCASRWCDRLLSPLVRVIRATPVASFILLVLLWVATGRVPVVISALMVLPVVWGNVSRGIRETDPQLLEMAAAYRLGPGRTLARIYLPSVAPYFTAGVETGLGLAWKAGVAAEVLCRPKLAIGTQVFYTRTYLETADLFAWTLVVIVLSLLLETALVRVLRKGVARHGPGA